MFTLCLVTGIAGCSAWISGSGNENEPPTYYFSHFVTSGDLGEARIESRALQEMLRNHLSYYLENRGLEEAEDPEESDYLVYYLILDDQYSFSMIEEWPYPASKQADELVEEDSVNLLIDVVLAQQDSLFFRGTSHVDHHDDNWIHRNLADAVNLAMEHLP